MYVCMYVSSLLQLDCYTFQAVIHRPPQYALLAVQNSHIILYGDLVSPGKIPGNKANIARMRSLLMHSQESTDGFYVLVESLLDDIFRFASLMSHVASHYEQPDYLTDVEEIAELSEMKEDILNRVSNAITQVCMCVNHQ